MRRPLICVLIAAACLDVAAQQHPGLSPAPDEPPPDTPILRVSSTIQQDALRHIIHITCRPTPLIIPAHPLHVGEHGVTAPRAIAAPEPEYPEKYRDSKTKSVGVVIIEMIVGADGTVINPRIIKSLNKEVDGHAIDAVRNWRFEPGRQKGQPVPVVIDVEIAFHIF